MVQKNFNRNHTIVIGSGPRLAGIKVVLLKDDVAVAGAIIPRVGKLVRTQVQGRDLCVWKILGQELGHAPEAATNLQDFRRRQAPFPQHVKQKPLLKTMVRKGSRLLVNVGLAAFQPVLIDVELLGHKFARASYQPGYQLGKAWRRAAPLSRDFPDAAESWAGPFTN